VLDVEHAKVHERTGFHGRDLLMSHPAAPTNFNMYLLLPVTFSLVTCSYTITVLHMNQPTAAWSDCTLFL
jgi:hypothetical protein